MEHLRVKVSNSADNSHASVGDEMLYGRPDRLPEACVHSPGARRRVLLVAAGGVESYLKRHGCESWGRASGGGCIWRGAR